MADTSTKLYDTPYGKKRGGLLTEAMDKFEATHIFIAVSYSEYDPDGKKDDNGIRIVNTKTEVWGPFTEEEADKHLADHRSKYQQFPAPPEIKGVSYTYIPLKMLRGVPTPHKLPRDERGYHPYHVYYKSESNGTTGFLTTARNDALWITRGEEGMYAKPEELQPGDRVTIPRAEGRISYGIVERVERKSLFWNDPR